MYDVIYYLNNIELLKVIDFTVEHKEPSKETTEDRMSFYKFYEPLNQSQEYILSSPIHCDVYGKKFELPMSVRNVTMVNSEDCFYENVEFTSEGLPTKVQILQDYGNHEGVLVGPDEIAINENLIMVGNYLDNESFGWFDGYLGFFVRFQSMLCFYKILKHPELDFSEIRCKRPFNTVWYVKKDDVMPSVKEDSRIHVRGVLDFIQDKESEEFDVSLEGLRIKDVYNISFVESSLMYYHRGLLNIPFMDDRAFTTVHYDWSGDDEIKSTDVCVHDWFFGTHTEGGEYEPKSVLEYYPVKISSVNHYEVSTSDGEIYGFENLRPIILTQDILTENLKGISDDAYENIVDITKNFTTIKYVHQLQRLLSLFGEKERAENFKIPENNQLIFKNS